MDMIVAILRWGEYADIWVEHHPISIYFIYHPAYALHCQTITMQLHIQSLIATILCITQAQSLCKSWSREIITKVTGILQVCCRLIMEEDRAHPQEQPLYRVNLHGLTLGNLGIMKSGGLGASMVPCGWEMKRS
jgi:hypothetical protein